MIFVTVGTHEQPFDRLVRYMDKWSGEHDEEVIMQTGFTEYVPKNCKWQKFYNYDWMQKLIEEARVVITHGGPSSFITPLQLGKLPIVVPRKYDLGEHVNDHQVVFCTKMEKRYGNIVVVNDIEKLGEEIDGIIIKQSKIKKSYHSHNAEFCDAFSKIVEELMRKR